MNDCISCHALARHIKLKQKMLNKKHYWTSTQKVNKNQSTMVNDCISCHALARHIKPLATRGMFTHLFGSVFHIFSCECLRGCRGTALPSPCINIFPPWLDGFTKVKTACPRRKKQKIFSKKHCLDFNAIIKQKPTHVGV